MKNNEIPNIISFRCLTCNEIIDKGLCGDHREETNHLDFEPIYDNLKGGIIE